jgi:hypothetical protein
MRGARLLLGLAFLLGGCSAIIGVKDLTYDEGAANDGGGGADGAKTDGGGGDGAAGDGSNDANACAADLLTDKNHCGRCEHSCAGGDCEAGRCKPLTLASGLGNPTGVAVDATHVYVTTYGDNTVLRVPKAGGTPEILATGQTKARGVVVDGDTLYWADADYPANGTDQVGGVWTCKIAGCMTNKKLLAAANWAVYPVLYKGYVYFSENNGSSVRKVKADGTGNVEIASTTKPFTLAVDDNHVYFVSNRPNIYRVPSAGGAEEPVASLATADYLGFIVLDADRVYYAYTETGGKGVVQSASKQTPSGPKITYGDDNKGSIGVTVDETNVYWVDEGTATGNATNNDGNVKTCPKTGCSASGPVVLADKCAFGGPLATDADAVYWVEFSTLGSTGGRLRKVAKP